MGRSGAFLSRVRVVVCSVELLVSCGGLGDLSPPPDAGGCTNWPMGVWDEPALEDVAASPPLPQGDAVEPTFPSLESEVAPAILDPVIPVRGSMARLLRFDEGGFPVCWVNLAFSVAMAAAASGNMALIVEASRPECRLVDDMVELRANEFRAESTLSLFMASLSRLDIGSCKEEQR